jgi:serine/threonine-protein kinase HipA
VLEVRLRDKLVGRLELRGPNRYRFQYADEVARAASPADRLSLSLPVRADAFSPSESRPFFEGLLPEGHVRATIARKLGVSEANGFALLEALGAECAGAVAIVPTGWQPAKSAIEWLDADELARAVEHLPRNPLGIGGDEEVRLSLGGVQDKLVLTRDASGRLGLPVRGAPSTHILKPSPEPYEDLAVNEAFSMRVAAHAGLPAARSALIEVGGEPCLLVERFDRTIDDGGRIVRIHQEDACQALGRMPSQKYEAEGGPSLAELFRLVRAAGGANAARDINTLLDAAVLNFVLGNSDAHGKNFAFLHEPGGVRLAPLYDVVSTQVYPGLTTRVAMSIGGEDQPDRVGMPEWATLASEAGLGGQALRRVQRQAETVLASVGAQIKVAEAEGWRRPVLDRIVEIAARRARQLLD